MKDGGEKPSLTQQVHPITPVPSSTILSMYFSKRQDSELARGGTVDLDSRRLFVDSSNDSDNAYHLNRVRIHKIQV